MWLIGLIIIIPLLICVGLYFYFVHSSISLWFNARLQGAKVSLFDIAFLRLERVSLQDIRQIVEKIIIASKAGVHIDIAGIGAYLMAGGNVTRLIDALIEAGNAKLNLTQDRASAIELAGRNVYEAVLMAIKPLVITTPEVSAMAQDGIQVKVKCSVTVRANLDRFLGGVGRQTILARVGTGIVGAIGSTANHHDIQATPAIITDHIWSIDRDEDDVSDIHQDAAYEVLSIDVSDVNIGKNLKAGLQAERAAANEKRARADKEKTRADYVTREEEMKARVYEMEAFRLRAEIEVPRAIAKAIREYKLSVKDYFKIRNINADTEMRKAFALLGENNQEQDK